jgi:hypothetical protein
LFWRTSDEVSRLKIQLIFSAREGVRQSVPEGAGYYSKEQEAHRDAGSSHVWCSVWTEVEYVAACATSREAVWLQKLQTIGLNLTCR